MAEKYFPITPYAYCAGDPVNYWDPDGSERVKKAPKGVMGSYRYYLWREQQYFARTGHASSYYGIYGLPNAMRFEKLKASGRLSKNAEQWVERVELELQEDIEEMLSYAEDKATQFEDGIEDYENNGLDVQAFNSHVEAYIKEYSSDIKLSSFSMKDLFLIVTTPQVKDLISKKGRKQAITVMCILLKEWGFLGYLSKAWDYLIHKDEILDAALRNFVELNIEEVKEFLNKPWSIFIRE